MLLFETKFFFISTVRISEGLLPWSYVSYSILDKERCIKKFDRGTHLPQTLSL